MTAPWNVYAMILNAELNIYCRPTQLEDCSCLLGECIPRVFFIMNAKTKMASFTESYFLKISPYNMNLRVF